MRIPARVHSNQVLDPLTLGLMSASYPMISLTTDPLQHTHEHHICIPQLESMIKVDLLQLTLEHDIHVSQLKIIQKKYSSATFERRIITSPFSNSYDLDMSLADIVCMIYIHPDSSPQNECWWLCAREIHLDSFLHEIREIVSSQTCYLEPYLHPSSLKSTECYVDRHITLEAE